MDVRSTLAAQAYTGARPATKPTAGDDKAAGAFARVAEDFAATLAQGDQTAKAAMTGRADSHALVTALAQSSLAVETAVAVRDKVVEAYQEILRMPI
jgi:flagellar hook-basal body complex protein FliE